MQDEKAAGGSARKRTRLLRYLLLAAVATGLFASTTLAKYASTFKGTATMTIAAFAGGSSVFDVTMEDMYPGCSPHVVNFTVQNYDGSGESDVMLDYSIQVETTGNMPLEFTLTGQRESDDNYADSRCVGSLAPSAEDPNVLTATGGRLPVAAIGGKKVHSYALKVTWPEAEDDSDYSHEIDMITVSVTTVQVNPTGGGTASGTT